MDKVSVIMPAYNASKFIVRSIRSILQQSYAKLELIVICDAPIDNTVELAKQFTDARIKIIEQEENLGVAEARNVGLRLATGRYIAFCDADDYWYQEKLSIQIELLKTSNSAVCHANCDLAKVAGKIIGSRRYPKVITYKMMRYRNYICNSSGLYDTKKISVVYQKKIYHEDYLMWLEILSESKISIGSKKPLLVYTINSNGLSSNKFKSFIGTLKIQRKHGVGWFEFNVNFLLNIASRLIELLLPSSRR